MGQIGYQGIGFKRPIQRAPPSCIRLLHGMHPIAMHLKRGNADNWLLEVIHYLGAIGANPLYILPCMQSQ